MNSELSIPPASPPRTKIGLRLLAFLLGGVVLSAVVISCGSLRQTIIMPPQIPGARYVGSDQCAECHQEYTTWFRTADHARLMAPGTNAVLAGCESCHGPGSIHVQVGGGPRTIINPHRTPEVCFQCHLDKRGQFNLPHHHPVLEGKISCVNCHDPHRGRAVRAGGTALLSEWDLCTECHIAQRGPFVFEHEALREGCTVCHAVHGSVNNKMLQQRNPNLCLKCHFQRQTETGVLLIGDVNHTTFLRRGTCWSAGCHEAPHGSQVSSLLRF